MWVIFALLDPDPLTRLNPDPIRIRIRNPAPKNIDCLDLFLVLFQDEDRQHDPLQRQEAPLEEDKAKAVNVQHELCGAKALLPLLYFITHLV